MILVAGALLAAGGPFVDLLFATERTASFDVDEPVTALDVSTRNGRIEVVVGPRVRVEADERWALREPRTTVEVDGGVVRIRATCPTGGWPLGSCQVSLRVTAPAELAARLESTNGAIVFDGRTGDVDALTTNGRVAGDALAARAVAARSTNGEIELDFTQAPAAVEARTVNGGVTVALPEGTYAVDASTTNGRVRVEVPTDDDAPRRVDAHSVNGPVSVLGP